MPNSDVKVARELIEQCRAIGWQVSRQGHAHLRVTPLGGDGQPVLDRVFSVASTPSSPWHLAYLRNNLKKAGFDEAWQRYEQTAEATRMARLNDDKRRNDAKLEQAAALAAQRSMRAELVDITPKIAREWLERGEGTADVKQRRRKVKTMKIIRLACANTLAGLPNGWQVTHQGIALGPDGEVIDGGNRLEVISEQPADSVWPCWVTFNAPPSSFTVLDTGSNRTPSDLLHMRGYDSDAHTISALKLLNMYRRYQAGEYNLPHWLQWRNTKLSGVEHLAERELWPDIERGVDYGREVFVKTGRGITRAAVGAWYCISSDAWPEGEEYRERFIEQLKTGENVKRGDAALTVRNWAIDGFGNGPHYDYTTIRERCLMALLKGSNAAFRRWTGQDPHEEYLKVTILKTEGMPLPFKPEESPKLSHASRAQAARRKASSE